MLKVKFPIGKDGRIRWFAVNEDSGRIPYSGFPNSFSTEQEAWEDAEWAIGAKVALVHEGSGIGLGFELFTGDREWDS